MPPEVIIEIVKIIPSILWFLFVSILIIRLYEPLKTQLLPRMSGFEAFGVKATFIKDELDKVADKTEVETKIRISEGDRSQVARRIERNASLLKGLQVLWVDDNPRFIKYESGLLRSLNMGVDVATSSSQAFSMMTKNEYDLVISDIAREGSPDEGVKFLAEMRRQGIFQPTLFYAGRIDESKGTPPYAFGITNRVDHLLHFVVDIAERVKG